MMSLWKAVLPRGWVQQELGMLGNFPVLLLLKMWQLRQPMGRW